MIRRKMRLITVAGLVLMLTFVLAGGAVAAKPEVAGGLAGGLSEEYIADEILVKFKPGVGPDAQDAIHRAQGATVKGRIHQIGVLVLRIPAGQVLEKVAAYQRNPNVEYAEPNFIAHAHWEPNDPLYWLQWHLDDQVEGGNPYGGENGGGINVGPAWDISTGEGVTVAVIDTGVAYEDYTEAIPIGRSGKYRYVTYALAPDLADTNFVPGYDFVNDDAQPNDDEGHGTHVTGTIAQSTNNNLGVAGVAFDCSIMPVKVLDAAGSGTYSDIADGIYYAADNADIINLSLGGTAESITLENAVAYAYNKGVTVIASAGNSGPGGAPSYPAAYDAYVIAVGATRYDEAVVYYSTTGSYLDLTAPGGQLYIEGTDEMLDQNGDDYWDGVLQQTHDGSDYTNFGYWFYQGTSMAAPHVSGVAALLIGIGVTGPDNVRQALQSTAEDHGQAGWDAEYGWGIVDAYAAVASVVTKPLSVEVSAPVLTNSVQFDVSATVTNTGDEMATGVEATITLPSGLSLTETEPAQNLTQAVGDIAAGGSVTATWSVIADADGEYNIRVDAVDSTATYSAYDTAIVMVDTTPPTISSVQAIGITDTSATITWATNEPSDSVVNYGTTTALGSQTSGTALVTSHSVTLSGLTPETPYYYEVQSTDEAGNTAMDNKDELYYTFTTAAEATTSTVTVSIEMSTETKQAGRNIFTTAVATVTIVDASGPVEGTTVSGHWSGLISDADSGVTDLKGVVILKSDQVKNASGRFTFTVDSVTKGEITYEPSGELSDYIDV